jgi:hypothetical protein
MRFERIITTQGGRLDLLYWSSPSPWLSGRSSRTLHSWTPPALRPGSPQLHNITHGTVKTRRRFQASISVFQAVTHQSLELCSGNYLRSWKPIAMLLIRAATACLSACFYGLREGWHVLSTECLLGNALYCGKFCNV